MKKLLVILLTLTFVIGSSLPSFASDWDKAGKALTIIEGLRLFTGGRVDVVGKIGEVATGRTYTNKQNSYNSHRHRDTYQKAVKHYECNQEKYWIPEYRWVKKHIPEHEETHEDYGTIIVSSHYIQIREECGGHWAYKESCHKFY